jgi:hypothetical protein
LSGTANFLNAETVTIGTTVYTFMTPWVDGTPFTVDCTTSLAATLQNLFDAINLTGTIGTQYGTGTTIHPTVTATANTATSLSARAKTRGTAGNLIATTKVTVGDMTWATTTLINGAGDVNVLTLSPDELPTWTLGKVAAIGSVTTRGTVCAYNATFGVHSLAEVSGSNAVSPKNLCILEDTVTHDPILSSGRVVYALFQSESNSDGSALTGTTPNRAMLSYVRINTGGTALEAVPTADIQGKTLHYASVGRKALEDLNEQDFLKGAVIDVTGPSYVDRQIAYDNQGITPVLLTTNALLNLNSAGEYWTIRDLAAADLFKITEGSTGGTSTVLLGVDVDTFDSSAIVNDFDKGIRARTGGVQINIGETTIASTGTIETTGSNDLRIFGARELFLDDGNQAGSTWAQTNGIKLSDTTAEWDAYEAAFGGEVSLLKGITDAFTKQKRTKKQAVLTADVVATNDVNGPSYANNTDVDLLPFNLVPTSFLQDVEVYLNGELLRNATGATEDVYPGTTPAQGDLKFTFKLKGTGAKPDQLTVIVNGQ